MLKMLWVTKQCCSCVPIWRKDIHILQFLGSSLIIQISLWDGWLVSGRSKKPLFRSGFPEWLRDPSSLVSGEYWEIFPQGYNCWGCEGYHPPPSSVKVNP
jgi:hypothetical protein